MEPLRAIERSRMVELTLAHSFLWMIGLVGIGAGTRRLRIQTLLRKKLEEEILTLSITDQLRACITEEGFYLLRSSS